MGSKKHKRRKKANTEWTNFQTLHQLSDADIRLARQTGYTLKRFQALLGTDTPETNSSKSQKIKEVHQQWTENAAKRRADIEAGVIEPKKNKKPTKVVKHDPKWAEAKRICRLNMDDIRKAKELGMSPQALIKNVPSPRQQWKQPVKVWIQELYEKRIASRAKTSRPGLSKTSDANRNSVADSSSPLSNESLINHESIVRDWEENAERDGEENYLFLRSFKFHDHGFDLDDSAKELHQTAFQVIDCTRCANCCKTTTPKFDESDVERIAAHLKMAPEVFIEKYLEPNPEDPPYRTRQAPCPLLGSDNRCTVYEVRPKVCRDFPYTDKEGLVSRTMCVANHSLACPAVYWIVDQLKQRAGK